MLLLIAIRNLCSSSILIQTAEGKHMRSPWKILSDLTSRKRVREEEQQSTEVEIDAPDAAIEVEQSPKRLESLREQTWDDLIERDKLPDVAPEKSGTKSSPAVLPEPNVYIADERQSDIVAKADSPKVQILPRKSQNRKSSAVKATPVQDRVAQESKPAKNADAPLPQAQKADPFLGELSALDDEIQQLRVTLAEKLQLQNAQLRKMLDRFGPR